MWESRELGDKWLCNHALLEPIKLRTFRLPLPESGTGGNVVNVLLDMGRNMILLSCHVLYARGVLPEEKLSKKEFFDFSRRCIKLDPLDGHVSTRELERSV